MSLASPQNKIEPLSKTWKFLRIFALAAFFVLFAFAWGNTNPVQTLTESWVVCFFKQLTHLPCPTCGLTRAFVLLSKGEWGQALQYNPLSPLAYLAALATTAGLWIAPQATVQALKKSLTAQAILITAALFGVTWVIKLAGDSTFW